MNKIRNVISKTMIVLLCIFELLLPISRYDTVVAKVETKTTPNEELGIEDIYYPELTNQAGENTYYTRLDYGRSEGTGKGVTMLVCEYKQDGIVNWNSTRNIYQYIVPDAEITYKTINNYMDTVVQLTDDLLESNDIVVLSKFDMKDTNLLSKIQKHRDTYFVLFADSEETKNLDFLTALKNISEQPNVLLVGSCSIHYFNNERVGKEAVSYVDCFAQPEISIMSNDYSIRNRLFSEGFLSESELADNTVSLAASGLAILLQNNTLFDNVGDYFKNNSKEWEINFTYNRNPDFRGTKCKVPLLDYKFLFKKIDGSNYSLESYKLPLEYTGKGLNIYLIDMHYNKNYSSTKDYIKKQIKFPSSLKEDYDLLKTEPGHANIMASILKTIVPSANVTLLYTKNSAKYEKAALDWVLKHKDKVDIVSMSWSVSNNKDKELLQKIQQVGEAGITIHWFWIPESADTNGNVIVPSAYPSKLDNMTAEALASDVRVMDSFFKDYETSSSKEWGNSQTSPTVAGLVAIIKQIQPKIKGTEIKKLFHEYAIEVESPYSDGLPDMERITTLLSKKLTYVSDIKINADNININVSGMTDIKVNGISYGTDSSLNIPYKSSYIVAIDKKGKRFAEGTQLIDLDLVKDTKGIYYIDSTFHGSVETDYGTIMITRGLNKIGVQKVNNVEKLTVLYQ